MFTSLSIVEVIFETKIIEKLNTLNKLKTLQFQKYDSELIKTSVDYRLDYRL